MDERYRRLALSGQDWRRPGWALRFLYRVLGWFLEVRDLYRAVSGWRGADYAVCPPGNHVLSGVFTISQTPWISPWYLDNRCHCAPALKLVALPFLPA